jgi:hypothetical protein
MKVVWCGVDNLIRHWPSGIGLTRRLAMRLWFFLVLNSRLSSSSTWVVGKWWWLTGIEEILYDSGDFMLFQKWRGSINSNRHNYRFLLKYVDIQWCQRYL